MFFFFYFRVIVYLSGVRTSELSSHEEPRSCQWTHSHQIWVLLGSINFDPLLLLLFVSSICGGNVARHLSSDYYLFLLCVVLDQPFQRSNFM